MLCIRKFVILAEKTVLTNLTKVSKGHKSANMQPKLMKLGIIAQK